MDKSFESVFIVHTAVWLALTLYTPTYFCKVLFCLFWFFFHAHPSCFDYEARHPNDVTYILTIYMTIGCKGAQLVISDGNMIFLSLSGFKMEQMEWFFVFMVNNTKLPKLHIFLQTFYKINEEIVRKSATDFQAPLCWMGTYMWEG